MFFVDKGIVTVEIPLVERRVHRAKVTAPVELPVRAGLISSHLLGLALCRYVLKVPPVVAMDREAIIRSVGPTLQRYIAGTL